MEDFYFYTIAIALIILIGILTMIGVILSYGNDTKVYPPIQNEGPDYWTKASPSEFGADVTANGINLPTGTNPTNFYKVPIGQTNPGNKEFQNGIVINPDYWTPAVDISGAKQPANTTGITGVRLGEGTSAKPYVFYIQLVGNDAEWTKLYPGITVRCAKQKWALDRGIVWDGVTNFNGCTVKTTTK